MKITPLPQPPLFKVGVLHQIQTKWTNTDRNRTEQDRWWYDQSSMQPFQTQAIQPLKVLLRVRQGLGIKTFRPLTILERGTGWLVHSHKQQNNTYFKKGSVDWFITVVTQQWKERRKTLAPLNLRYWNLGNNRQSPKNKTTTMVLATSSRGPLMTEAARVL